MRICDKVKFMRQLKGYSQEEMAEKLGMSVNGYSNIERGETDLQMSRIEEIAKTLHIDTLELLSFGEKNVYYQQGARDNYGQYNLINDVQSKFQLEKAQLIIDQKEKEVEYLKQQVTDLRGMIELLKNK